MESKLHKLTKKIIKFRKIRDWEQFHNPKDQAISLALEAHEVLEHFQWLNTEEMKKHVKDHKDEIGEELADCLYYLILMSSDYHIDLLDALEKKLLKNAKKYPVEKAKGKHTKYTHLT
jgi:NTP pyrophosphatase (non-canonical NTP hydrolase)